MSRLAVAAIACLTGCAGQALSEDFGGSLREVSSDGRLGILSAGEVRYVRLADFRVPQLGENGHERINTIVQLFASIPLQCHVLRVRPDASDAKCYIEGRTSLGETLRQDGLPESPNTVQPD
jgi:hypothetical protein